MQAPHHTTNSWLAYWNRHHDLPDKIYAAAIGDDRYEQEWKEANESEGYEDNGFRYQSDMRSPNSDYDDSESGSEPSSSSDHDDTGSSFELGTDSGSDDEGAGRKTSNDRHKMGKEGELYTKADLRVAAGYIASVPGWYELNHRERWEPYAKKVGLMIS
jgi:hypothetical protein